MKRILGFYFLSKKRYSVKWIKPGVRSGCFLGFFGDFDDGEQEDQAKEEAEAGLEGEED